MNQKFLCSSVIKNLSIMLFGVAFLFGCQTQKTQSQNNQGANQPIYTMEPQNLADDGQAIMLARDMINEDAINDAISILKPLSFDQLAENEKQLYILARGELAIARFDVEEANYWLAGQYTYLFDRASKVKQINLRFLKSDVAEMNQDYLSAARERIFVDVELSGAIKQQNHDVIWENLLKLGPEQISYFLKSAGNQYSAFDLTGWLQLAFQIQSVKGQIYVQNQVLNQWLSTHSSHPAAMMLPTSLSMLSEALKNQPKQIAVMVPITGKYGIVGRSIQAGILSQYYHNVSQSNPVGNIRFYDTGGDNLNIINLYNQAVSDGAEFVIGPFFEKPVNELANFEGITVPVLLLRSTNQPAVVADKVMQFDLSLNHEVTRVAEQAITDGHRNAAIIYTKDSTRRQEFAKIFEQRFTQLGGRIVARTPLDTKQKFIYSVKELMGIDDSEKRAQMVYQLLDQSINNFEVRPRRDIDMIFMVVSQDESVRLKPIFNQQYASEIPFYGLSDIYSGGQLPKQYDFDNIRLQTMPWQLQGVTHNQLPERNELTTAYQANEVSVSIAAQGVDAYSIMMQFDIFKQFEANTISGVTGNLHQPTPGVIHSNRDWIIIERNKIKPYEVDQ
ncbi:penicillin-binding protein activator [Marinicellulosiphila megalodicopiae]|uniref:penicillin-binding protein activator n=1 Tax=Marinicellulosiphila megalodicopiae TaxID=2724896 RepID=UPI003BAF51A8